MYMKLYNNTYNIKLIKCEKFPINFNSIIHLIPKSKYIFIHKMRYKNMLMYGFDLYIKKI